jgi:hypothetical protein
VIIGDESYVQLDPSFKIVPPDKSISNPQCFHELGGCAAAGGLMSLLFEDLFKRLNIEICLLPHNSVTDTTAQL